MFHKVTHLQFKLIISLSNTITFSNDDLIFNSQFGIKYIEMPEVTKGKENK